MTITIVTPWFERMQLAGGYWAAIAAAGTPPTLVVDNGSEPPLPNGVRVDHNAGFARACNIGLELARTDAVLFLNNDVACVQPGWLDPIVAALEPGVLVGAQLRNDPHSWVDGHPLPYLDGWCLAGMRDDLLDIGGWDESYAEPSYYGDNDLCLRARAAGMVLREVRVGLRHLTNGTSDPSDPRVVAATVANRARFESSVRELMGAAVG